MQQYFLIGKRIALSILSLLPSLLTSVIYAMTFAYIESGGETEKPKQVLINDGLIIMMVPFLMNIWSEKERTNRIIGVLAGGVGRILLYHIPFVIFAYVLMGTVGENIGRLLSYGATLVVLSFVFILIGTFSAKFIFNRITLKKTEKK